MLSQPDVSRSSSPPPDLSAWLTKTEVAQLLGVTERTVDRYVGDGQINRAYRRVPGRREMPVFHPGDVDRIRTATVEMQPFVMPNEPAPMVRGALVPAAGGMGWTAGRRLLLAPAAQPAPEPSPLFVSIEEAARLTGLSKALLHRLCMGRLIPSVRDVSWKIHREWLDTGLREIHLWDGPAK